MNTKDGDGDKRWVLFDANTHRAMWLPGGEDLPTQNKSSLHPKKCLLFCFWVRDECSTTSCSRKDTVTGSIYANQLQNPTDVVR